MPVLQVITFGALVDINRTYLTTLDYSCPIIPCHLLVRRDISSHTAYSSRYLIRTFDTFFLSRKISEKRLSPEEYHERLSKRLRLV